MTPGVPPSQIHWAVDSNWTRVADEDECPASGQVMETGNNGLLFDPEGGSKSSCSSLWWSIVLSPMNIGLLGHYMYRTPHGKFHNIHHTFCRFTLMHSLWENFPFVHQFSVCTSTTPPFPHLPSGALFTCLPASCIVIYVGHSRLWYCLIFWWFNLWFTCLCFVATSSPFIFLQSMLCCMCAVSLRACILYLLWISTSSSAPATFLFQPTRSSTSMSSFITYDILRLNALGLGYRLGTLGTILVEHAHTRDRKSFIHFDFPS